MKLNDVLILTPLIDPNAYPNNFVNGTKIDSSLYNRPILSSDIQTKDTSTGLVINLVGIPNIIVFWGDGDIRIPNITFQTDILSQIIHTFSEFMTTTNPNIWPQGQTLTTCQFWVGSLYSYGPNTPEYGVLVGNYSGHSSLRKYGSPGSVITPPKCVRIIPCRISEMGCGGESNGVMYLNGAFPWTFPWNPYIPPIPVPPFPAQNLNTTTGELNPPTDINGNPFWFGRSTLPYLQTFTDAGQIELLKQALAFDLAYLQLTQTLQAKFPDIYFHYVPLSSCGLGQYISSFNSSFFNTHPLNLSEMLGLMDSTVGGFTVLFNRFLQATAETLPYKVTSGTFAVNQNIGDTVLSINFSGRVQDNNYMYINDTNYGYRRVINHVENSNGDTIQVTINTPLVYAMSAGVSFTIATVATYMWPLDIYSVNESYSTVAADIEEGGTVISINGLNRTVSVGDVAQFYFLQGTLDVFFTIVAHEETSGVTTRITLDHGVPSRIPTGWSIGIAQTYGQLWNGFTEFPQSGSFQSSGGWQVPLKVNDNSGGFPAGITVLNFDPAKREPIHIWPFKSGDWIAFTCDNLLYQIEQIVGDENDLILSITLKTALINPITTQCILLLFSELPGKGFIRGDVLNLVIVSDASLGFSNPYYQSFPGGTLNTGLTVGPPKTNKYAWQQDVQILMNSVKMYARNNTIFFYDNSPPQPVEQIMRTFGLQQFYSDAYDTFVPNAGVIYSLIDQVQPGYANADLNGIPYWFVPSPKILGEPVGLSASYIQYCEVINIFDEIQRNTEGWLRNIIADTELTPPELGFSFDSVIQYANLDITYFTNIISQFFSIDPLP